MTPSEKFIESFAAMRRRVPLHKLEDYDYSWTELKRLMMLVDMEISTMRDCVPKPTHTDGNGKTTDVDG